ncbi:MAG: hypothetical protein QUV71_07525 [Rhizobium sp.]|nr:hypothetical protein [Rhizobium sp.]
MRLHNMGGLKTLPAGKMVPLAAAGVLREDQIRSGPIRFSFAHHEMDEILLNAVNVRVLAYFVPMLAMARFNGSMDQLNQSYEGRPPIAGQPVVPFIETAAFGAHGANSIAKYMGIHGAPTDVLNTSYWEAYNIIWNYRAKNRSPKLALRTRLQTDLAPAFWIHDQFSHIVPNFDAASMDGNVPVQIVNPLMPVKGSVDNRYVPVQLNGTLRTSVNISGSDARTVSHGPVSNGVQYSGASQTGNIQHIEGLRADLQNVFAELTASGLSMSLASIELATKTKAFAEVRKKYNGNDEWVTNLLMDGIYVAEQDLKNPILVGQDRTFFGQSKRYASDAANMTVSAVDGMTEVQMNIRVPRMNTGGVLMLVAEITPDQLFERQFDPWLDAKSVDDLPQYLRDELDPEKVEIVKNGWIDVAHATPNGTFGYAPLNSKWNVQAMRVGGDLYRPVTNTATDSDRQRLWSAETINPALATDFYLCTNLHLKPFKNRNRDPFECTIRGELMIEGNTVFGGHLIEAHPANDYQKVLELAPQNKIEQVV